MTHDEILAQLQGCRLPEWEELPDFGLYMDQLVTYVARTFPGISGRLDLTPSMINKTDPAGCDEQDPSPGTRNGDGGHVPRFCGYAAPGQKRNHCERRNPRIGLCPGIRVAAAGAAPAAGLILRGGFILIFCFANEKTPFDKSSNDVFCMLVRV